MVAISIRDIMLDGSRINLAANVVWRERRATYSRWDAYADTSQASFESLALDVVAADRAETNLPLHFNGVQRFADAAGSTGEGTLTARASIEQYAEARAVFNSEWRVAHRALRTARTVHAALQPA